MKAASSTPGRYWFLDSVAGWREASREHLELTSPDGSLILDPLPGAASLLFDTEAQASEFKCPSALSSDGRGNVLVVDAVMNVVKRINLQSNFVETLPGIGGKGNAPRQLRESRGVAALSSGAVVVSDTGNHHIKIFSAAVYALIQDWGANDPLRRPAPEAGPKMFRRPWAVAVDGCDTVYVVDRGNRRVQKIASGARSFQPIGADLLHDPTRLAIDPNNVLAVVDPGQAAVFIFATEGEQLWGICPTKNEPRSVAFDRNGTLYIGDAIGQLHVFKPDSPALGKYRLVGVADTGVSGEVVDLTWDGSQDLLVAIIHENFNGRQQRLWKINPVGAPTHTGTLITKALDSKMQACRWHRVLLNAKVPEGTSIQIESFTSDDNPTREVTNSQLKGWELCLLSGDNNPDCLVQSGPGRYLWVRLTFNSNGLESPELHSLKAFYPRASYLQYLPAVYQEDEESSLFLERFLSIFQSEFDHIDDQIDRLWQLFNPGSILAKHLPWLAAWFALPVNPNWPESKFRSMVKDAFQTYRMRGTVEGLKKAINDWTGVEANIVEHFQLRRLPLLSIAASLNGGIRLWSPDFYRRLQLNSYSQIGSFQLTSQPEPGVEALTWGAHEFTVLFPASPYGFDDVQRQITQVVEREKPAHTQATVCPVFPRFRIGVQATIGADTVVGGISYLVLNRLATLGYDSILGFSKEELKLRELGLTPRPVVGRSSRLS
jgi:phage tail-like protein